MISPIIDQLADEYAGKLKVTKVNVDDNQELAIRFGVMSIPMLIVFKNGKPVDQIIGAVSKDHLAGKLKQHL
jgi:thioredoxin 1